MSALAELARELGNGGGSSGTGAALVFGHVTKDTQHDGEVAIQADGLPLDEEDMGFAEGLRQSVTRGDRVLLLRSADGQHYDVLLTMEGG